jgi:hypothetical protein
MPLMFTWLTQLAIDFWLQTNEQVGPDFKNKKTQGALWLED